VTAPKYAPTTLAAAETEQAAVCGRCGALVADTGLHDKFHDVLRQLGPAKPKGETRAK
jgi:hypothetical protein